MDRVCILKSSGEVLEFQSGGFEEGNKELSDKRLSVLLENAINSGYKEDQIEVKWVSEEQTSVILDAINNSEDMIVNKVVYEKIREMAIRELISEGKLTEQGKLKYIK